MAGRIKAASAGTNGNANIAKDGNSGDASASVKANSTTSANGGCIGCGVACNHTNISPYGALCNSCFHHWRYRIVSYRMGEGWLNVRT